ncbi:GNAT family N-acetyltransferase [Brachybacterium sp. YJGR34]|uniref:GNAT family N-acetyltransferase n=1 Tax=Brachybacterium sp. YJGR34 TaxID=2059911 RepID=UPI000E0B3C3B|nr:GNAT family N-acetyltransferase [Brachybacterium sp. YJGR34]
MATTLTTPSAGEVPAMLETLRSWQRDDAPVHLHPGDIGWHGGRGAERTAADLRIWSLAGGPTAIGMLDGPDLLRLAVDPVHVRDRDLASRMADDLCDPSGGALPDGEVFLEARSATALRTVLGERGWQEDEPWVVLRRDLGDPVEESALSLEVVGAADPSDFTAVHRSAFASPACTDERWRTLAAQSAARDATALLGRDRSGAAVAIAMVWPAGPGRPGLIEPMGVHAEHRGRGHGRAICRAAAARLRADGSSSAVVVTPRSLTGAVATYEAAGFRAGTDSRDLRRPADQRR